MSYITKDKAITINGNTWWVNSKGSGLYTHIIKAMINQVDAMLSHHSKLHIIRFDLRQYEYTDNSDKITSFNRRFHKWLKRHYNLNRIGYMWARERDKAKKQHYHYALIIDGHKANYPASILKKAKDIWESLQGSEFTPKNCYYNVRRGEYRQLQRAIWRISYLAKVRSKGKHKRPDQTKDYSTSRIKPRYK